MIQVQFLRLCQNGDLDVGSNSKISLNLFESVGIHNVAPSTKRSCNTSSDTL